MNKKNELKLTGNILFFDQKNLNGRVYTKEVAESIIEQFKKIRGEEGVFLGEFGYPSTAWTNGINLGNISHDVVDLRINEDTKSLEGDMLILETPAGKKLRELILAEGENVGISCRPRGTGKVNGKGEIEEYQIISFDLIPTSLDSFGKRIS